MSGCPRKRIPRSNSERSSSETGSLATCTTQSHLCMGAQVRRSRKRGPDRLSLHPVRKIVTLRAQFVSHQGFDGFIRHRWKFITNLAQRIEIVEGKQISSPAQKLRKCGIQTAQLLERAFELSLRSAAVSFASCIRRNGYGCKRTRRLPGRTGGRRPEVWLPV